jgi:hypothetical protein
VHQARRALKQKQAPPCTPAFAAAMASWLGMPWRATAEEQNAIEPPVGCRIIALTDGRRTLKQLNKFVRSVWRAGAAEPAGNGSWDGWGQQPVILETSLKDSSSQALFLRRYRKQPRGRLQVG